jgi:hypothetical protein
MRRIVLLLLCVSCVQGGEARAQSPAIEPLQESAGTVLTFYLQTRMAPESVDVLDTLPKGTVLRVKLLNSVDSSVSRDGAEFRGELASPVYTEDHKLLFNTDAQIHGLFVLLRSRNHPEGFRYDLLATSLSENGKSYDLTASLRPSFSDAAKSPVQSSEPNPVQAEKLQESH